MSVCLLSLYVLSVAKKLNRAKTPTLNKPFMLYAYALQSILKVIIIGTMCSLNHDCITRSSYYLHTGGRFVVNYCHHLASVVCELFTFQAFSPKPLGQLEPNLAGMFLGWSSTKFLFCVPVWYSTWLPDPIIWSDWLKFQRSSSLKLMNWLNPNCKWMIIGMSFAKFLFLYTDRKYKIAATAGNRLTLDPMRKCSNAFFSETTNMIKAKLNMNVHWMVLYKL